MAKKQPTVAAYLAQLAHPRKDEIERVRAIVLGAAPGLAERVRERFEKSLYNAGSAMPLILRLSCQPDAGLETRPTH